MKPDWDKLATEFDEHATTLIGDVDCTADGKPLCDKVGVRGYPTIKHGDVNNLEDYKGGRDLAALQKFAKGLKPVCSPAKLDLCDDETKAKITELQAMSAADLDKAIKEKEDESAAAEKKFTDEVDKLQKKYQELQEEKEATLQAVKDSGLGLMKSVKAAGGKSEL
jgi:hypothetical protein